MTNFEFQKLAYDKFAKMKVGALFMKMGSGKTKVAVDLANANKSKVNLLLWICPNQVRDSTIRELKKWGPATSFRVVSYESISQSERIFNEIRSRVVDKNVFLVLDESIFIKNGQTKRWARCKELRTLSKYCIILNGTPVVKDEMDLFWQMKMLDDRIIPYDEPTFKRMFFDETTYRPRRGVKIKKYQFSKKNAEVLAKLIAPYTFKVDVDYGVAVEDNVHIVSPTIETLAEYASLKEEVIDNIRSKNAFMGQLTRMMYIAATDKNRIAKTKEIVSGSSEPCIVYGLFRHENELLSKALNSNWVIKGDTKRDERRRYFELFEITKEHPLILSFGTGSYGLNLQFASRVVFNSYGWNYGTLEQAKARVLRIGQKNRVRFDFVEVDLPIQKLVRKCIDNKIEMLDFVKSELMNNAEKAEELL